MLIPICFFVLVLADYFEQMDNNIVKIIYNIVAVVVLILIYNRISNHIEYSYAAEPPVQFRLSHLSRRSEPL